MALCSGLAPLTNNHFGRCALLWGRLRLHAINATAPIELRRSASRCGVASRDYEQAAIHDRDTQLDSIVIGVLIGAAALGVGVALGVAVALVLHHAFG